MARPFILIPFFCVNVCKFFTLWFSNKVFIVLPDIDLHVILLVSNLVLISSILIHQLIQSGSIKFL